MDFIGDSDWQLQGTLGKGQPCGQPREMVASENSGPPPPKRIKRKQQIVCLLVSPKKQSKRGSHFWIARKSRRPLKLEGKLKGQRPIKVTTVGLRAPIKKKKHQQEPLDFESPPADGEFLCKTLRAPADLPRHLPNMAVGQKIVPRMDPW